ncbi:MAG: hypothetical protein BWY14_01138 [Parcubacteria group bacterium ADurb.Bin192]|nr:MAG: hypothetical protein BWY14_01138 [Parcubacteria group bacterium ADurb.Bin192]
MSRIKLSRSVIVAKETFLHERSELEGGSFVRVNTGYTIPIELTDCNINPGSIQKMKTSDTRPSIEALGIDGYGPDCLIRNIHLQGHLDNPHDPINQRTAFSASCYVYSKGFMESQGATHCYRAWYPFILTFTLEVPPGEIQRRHFYLDGWLAGKRIKQNTILPILSSLKPAWGRNRRGTIYVPLSERLGTQTDKPNS